jgi:Holliday junction resolvase RusA-like endonuclease
VSVNRWHVVRRGRIHASREYETFVNSVSLAIRAAAAQAGIREPWKKASLTVTCSLPALSDHHNLCKPLADAVERAGLIDDDRHITTVRMDDSGHHGRGKPDEIWLFLSEEGA